MSDNEENFLGFDEDTVDLPLPEVLKTSKNKDLLSYRGFVYYSNRKPVSIYLFFATC